MPMVKWSLCIFFSAVPLLATVKNWANPVKLRKIMGDEEDLS